MRLEIEKRVDGDRLYGELVEALPELAPVPADDGVTNAETPLGLLYDAERVALEVPDGTSEAELRAVVDAHDPDGG